MKITIEQLECKRCGHTWWPRIRDDGSIVMPARCANKKCNSPYWSKPRKTKEPIVVIAEVSNIGPALQKEIEEKELQEFMKFVHIKPEKRELLLEAEKICLEKYGNPISSVKLHEVIDELQTLKRRQEHKPAGKEIKRTA